MQRNFKVYITFLLLVLTSSVYASKILIPMNEGQKNHLKAYGIAYWILQNEVEMHWLLNYEGGSFLVAYAESIEKECKIRGVSYQVIADNKAEAIFAEIANPEINMESLKLEKAPKIAVYTPGGKQPWDDAVTLVLTYAEIPFDKIYDSAIVSGALKDYEWLHLHHEDFTGQYGKFYSSYRYAAWYQEQQRKAEREAKALGFSKVSDLKLNVATSIKDYIFGGGFLFTMCSGTDSYDIALAAAEIDICAEMFDGDPADPNANSKLVYENGLAFKDYKLKTSPMEYEYSDIDATKDHVNLGEEDDYFELFDFSAKWDVVPTILNQNHVKSVPGFMGQTTSFYRSFIRTDVTVLGFTPSVKSAKYIHGTYGKGQWTYYGGHDPEDYMHRVGDPPTDLSLHPNSAGYRLILNNILFPAAKKKKQKT